MVGAILTAALIANSALWMPVEMALAQWEAWVEAVLKA